MNFGATAYGLVFDSAIPIPELTALSFSDENRPETDVTIRIGNVPDSLENPSGMGVLYQASVNQFLFKLDRVAKYLVCNGNEITIEPAPGADENDVRVFMLGSVFGALLHQRQFLVIHAGAIKTELGAVLFAGPSGIGKSTLLGEMMKRGYPMLVDDVCAVVLDNTGKPVVLPGYPRTRLWADSAQKLEISTDGLQRTRAQLEKFECQKPDQFWDHSVNFHKIYVLSTHNEEGISIDAMPALQKFQAILHNTYRRAFLKGLEMREVHFSLVASVTEHCEVCDVVRPSEHFMLTELADHIEDNFSV